MAELKSMSQTDSNRKGLINQIVELKRQIAAANYVAPKVQLNVSGKVFTFEVDKLGGVIADLNSEGYRIAATPEYMLSNLRECHMGYFNGNEEATFSLIN